MSFNSFGYDGVLEASEPLINKLLGSEFYEHNLVKKGGAIANDDFYILSLGNNGTGLTVYLLLGKPVLTFTGADATNQLSILVRLYNLSIYANDGATSTPLYHIDGGFYPGILVKSVKLLKTTGGLTIDLSAVNEQSLEFDGFVFKEWPDHVGGVAGPGIPAGDNYIDQLLKTANVQLTAADLKKAIVAGLKGDLLKKTTIPLDLSLPVSSISEWDLKTYDSAASNPGSNALNAGASLLLYEAQGKGQGVQGNATDTIPDSAFGPRFSWTAALRADVLLTEINSLLDRGLFPTQNSGARNTTTNPFGFMVVPAAAPQSFSISGGTNNVKIDPPSGATVKVTISTGGMSPNGRATLKVEGSGTSQNFTANGDGSAEITINAAAGDRLTLTVYAISLSGDSSIVIWRPKLSFVNGGIKAAFHYYVYIDNMCDAEGDGWAIIKLTADRTQAFAPGFEAGDSDFDYPWWAYFAAWFGPALILGPIGSIIIESLLPTVFKDLIKDAIDFSSKLKNLGELDKIAKAPSFSGAALFLDYIDATESGLVFAGFADSGQILSYGRTTAISTNGTKILQSASVDTLAMPSFYSVLDWQPGLGSVSIKARGGNARVITDNPAEQFWNANYDELRDLNSSQTTADLASGSSALMIIDDNFMLCKILLERFPNDGDTPNTTILVTWIAYQKRISQSVRLKNNIKTTLLSSYESVVLKRSFYSYQGSLDLDTAKFFLSADTEMAGQEVWKWNGQTITNGVITFPGGTISIIPGAHSLWFDINQNTLSDLTGAIFYHQIEFSGTDVFGRTQTATINLSLPAMLLSAKKISGIDPGATWKDHWGPYINPVRDFNPAIILNAAALLQEVLPDPEFSGIIRTLGDALTGGRATINNNQASLLIDMLIQGRIG